jgi:uncharacterized membrane protein YhaH (DUF805 family)
MSVSVQPDEVPLAWPYYNVSFGGAIRRGFKKYATFSGRASRSEYWWWVAFIFVALSLLGVAALWFGTATAPDGGSFGRGAYPFIIAMGVFLLAIIVPSIALAVRRLHDAGYSGLIYLLNLIPSIGGLIVAVLCILPTSPKAGRYGPPDPGHHFARG